MRKATATILALGIVWIGYTAWPLYDLLVLVRAIEVRDVETVKRHVYFDAVRRSLSSQLIAAYMRRTGNKVSPLAQSMAAAALGIADPVLNKLVSPEALSELLCRVAGDGSAEPTPGYGWDIDEHDRDHLADFWKFGIWHWQIRSVSAVGATATAALRPYISALAVALAASRHLLARGDSESAC